MGILGSLFGVSDEASSDFGSRLALAGQVLMAMDQGQVANIGPSVAVLNERRRKIADEMQSKKWLQNQAAMMADKNPQLAQFLENAPPEVGASLISKYYETLLAPPDLKTFEVGGSVYRGDPNDPNAQPQLWIQGPGPKPDRVEVGGGYYEFAPDGTMQTLIPPQPKTPDGEFGAYLEDQKRREAQGLPTQLFAEWKVSMQKPESRYRPATPEEKAAIGLKPDAPVQIDEVTNKAVVVSGNGVQVINEAPKVGNIPPGMQLIQDPATGGYRLEAIPGGPVAAEQDTAALKNERKAVQKQQAVDIVTQDIDRALTLLDNDSWMNPATGLGAGTMARFGGTNAANLVELTTTIASNISKEGMNQMRENSPTGAGMGTVSDADLAMLKTALGSVNNSQSEEQLRYNLNRLWNLYQDTIHGPNGGPPRRQLTPPADGQAAQPAPANPPKVLKWDPQKGLTQ